MFKLLKNAFFVVDIDLAIIEEKVKIKNVEHGTSILI